MKKLQVTDKLKSLVTSATEWLGAGIIILGTYLGWGTGVISAIAITTGAVITIENAWLQVV